MKNFAVMRENLFAANGKFSVNPIPVNTMAE